LQNFFRPCCAPRFSSSSRCKFVLDHLHGETSLTTVKHLSAKQVNEVPLPPVAEQHRIVAKVDELMALCDRLEAARAERLNRRLTCYLARALDRAVSTPHTSRFTPKNSRFDLTGNFGAQPRASSGIFPRTKGR
jgi:hypothetical protein